MDRLCKVFVVLALFVVPGIGLAIGFESRESSRLASNVPSLHTKRRTADDVKQLEPAEMMSDLRDFRLCLIQLKQQSVNLFQEATRTVMTEKDTPVLETPNVISTSMLNSKDAYLSPRKEWLVFYVNTLEPVIHLLCEDIHDVDTNGRKCPQQIERRVSPLWESWRNDVHKINKSLDEVQDAIADESGSNVRIAKAAISIYNTAQDLEKVRYKVAVIFKEEYAKVNRKH